MFNIYIEATTKSHVNVKNVLCKSSRDPPDLEAAVTSYCGNCGNVPHFHAHRPSVKRKQALAAKRTGTSS